MTQNVEAARTNLTLIKALTYLMFMMFAMTTDSVGLIIPEIIKTFGLSMTVAGTFHYATMGELRWPVSSSVLWPTGWAASLPLSLA